MLEPVTEQKYKVSYFLKPSASEVGSDITIETIISQERMKTKKVITEIDQIELGNL